MKKYRSKAVKRIYNRYGMSKRSFKSLKNIMRARRRYKR